MGTAAQTLARFAAEGMPADPIAAAELRRKFMRLTSDLGKAHGAQLFERLAGLESLRAFSISH